MCQFEVSQRRDMQWKKRYAHGADAVLLRCLTLLLRWPMCVSDESNERSSVRDELCDSDAKAMRAMLTMRAMRNGARLRMAAGRGE